MTTPLRILYLEDKPSDLELVRESLKKEGLQSEIVHAKGREEFEAALDEQRFDLILSDYSLPAFDGLSRHSGSQTARIDLGRSPHEVWLEVRDFGRGIAPELLDPPDTASALGVGIAGMRERVCQLGGYLEIDAGADGTTVRAFLPLPLSAPKQ